MRPQIKFLGKNLIQQIVAEAYQILCTLGIEIHNKNVLEMFSDHGAKVDIDKNHVIFKEAMIQKALKSFYDERLDTSYDVKNCTTLCSARSNYGKCSVCECRRSIPRFCTTKLRVTA